MNEQIKGLRTKVKRYVEFLGIRSLTEAFDEFIRPKTALEQLAEKQKIVDQEKERKKTVEITHTRKHNIAI